MSTSGAGTSCGLVPPNARTHASARLPLLYGSERNKLHVQQWYHTAHGAIILCLERRVPIASKIQRGCGVVCGSHVHVKALGDARQHGVFCGVGYAAAHRQRESARARERERERERESVRARVIGSQARSFHA